MFVMEDRLDVSVNYEKCKVLIKALACAEDSDKETLIWMLEEYYERLGDAIGKFRML